MTFLFYLHDFIGVMLKFTRFKKLTKKREEYSERKRTNAITLVKILTYLIN